MFSPTPMLYLRAIVLRKDERPLLDFLGEAGAVQLIHTPAGPETAPLAPDDYSLDHARCDRILETVETLREALEIQPKPAAWQIKRLTMEEAEQKAGAIEEHVRHKIEHRRQLLRAINQLSAECDQMSGYEGLGIPLDEQDSFSFLHFVTGTIPVDKLNGLKNKIGAGGALIPVAQLKGQQSILVMTDNRNRTAIGDLLQNSGFQYHQLPKAPGKTADVFYEEKREELSRARAELDLLNAELKQSGVEFERTIDQIAESVRAECLLLNARIAFPRSQSTILINGWVPADQSDEIKRGLDKITAGRFVLDMAPPDNDTSVQVPILVRYPRLLRPFGMLVSTYGLPNYRELEPTLLVALSYIIMFGMMFGDVGHGAVLCALGISALLFARNDSIRDGGILLLAGGISSIIFGSVYGSFFGLEHFKRYALWHDPLEGNPMKLMYGAIGLGIIMISIGLILNVINRFRRGDPLGALLDKFGLTGLLFYWGALALFLQGKAIQSAGLMLPLSILFIGVPIFGWILKEPLEYLHDNTKHHRKTSGAKLIGAVLESFIEAFEALLSYLANTISFVRLAAYAMSHAALLVAAFMVAEEVRHFTYGGTLFSILIIVLGNLVAIVLEGIIASVQALRLEYYEFFGKFFSGDGKRFEPFRLNRSN